MSTTIKLLAAAVALSLLSPPAHALTTGEVVEKMSPEQFSPWLTGSVDMAAHLFRRLGDRERAECVLRWHAGTKEAVREVDAVFRANPTLNAAAALEILMKRHCGDYK